MGTIPIYQTEESAGADIPGRSASANDFGYRGGTSLMTAAAGAGQLGDKTYQIAQEREVSDVNAQMAALRSKWTVELANRAEQTDAGDMHFADQFTQDFQTDLEKLQGGLATVGGQAAFKQSASNLSAHFVESAGVYQAQSAGVKAAQDYKSFLDNNRNALLHDPTQFASVLQDANNALNDPNGPFAKLPKGKRDEFARIGAADLAKSSVQGLIRVDPMLAKKELESGKWDKWMDADTTVVLSGEADTAIRGIEIEKARIEAAQAKARSDADRAAQNGFIAKMVEDPTSLSAKDIVHSDLSPENKIQFLGLLSRGIDGSKGDLPKGDAATYMSLLSQIHNGTLTDDNALNKYADQGAITLSQLNDLRNEVQGNNTEAGQTESKLKEGLLKVARTAISGTNELLNVKDPKGEENLQRWTAQFLSDYNKKRKEGKTPTELLDPNSPDYLGKSIDQFKRNPQDFMKDLMTDNPFSDLGGGAPSVGNLPTVTTKAEFDALKSGDHYLKDGVEKVKP